MNKRKLGDLVVSALGLGCMGMSEFYGSSEEREAIKVIHRAVELGVTLFDTADVYGMGANEKLVGEALAGKRERVVIATKFGILRDPEDPMYRGIDGRPEYVRRSCERSLKALGTDYIDLFYQHRVDPKVPIEETVGAMSELVAEGKVRYIGLSEAGSETLRRANATHPISALQSEYSLGSRDVEANGILKTTRDLGVGFVAYSPLSRALLTGEIPTEFADDDFRQYLPRFSKEHAEQNQRISHTLADIAASKNCSVAQLSLAWILAQGDSIVPIPGTKHLKYLQENIATVNVALSQQDLAMIEKVIDDYQLKGERYPEGCYYD